MFLVFEFILESSDINFNLIEFFPFPSVRFQDVFEIIPQEIPEMLNLPNLPPSPFPLFLTQL